MSDNILNALNQQQGQSNLISVLSSADVANPLAAINAGTTAAKNTMELRQQQGQQLWGQALQQATDENGNVDYQKAQRIAAGMGPAAAMYATTALGNNATQRGQQINNAAGIYKTTGIAAMSIAKDPSDAGVNSAFDNMIASGLPASQVNPERQRVMNMSLTDRQNYAYQHGLSVLDTLHQVIGQTTLQPVGGTMAPVTLNQPSANASGSATVGPGSIPITPTPGEALQGGYHYQATQADVDAGRATKVGQDIYIPGAEIYRRAGLPVPPGLQTPSGGTGGSGGVVDSSGKPVSAANPPRLLNVPSQAPNAATPPAPPGGTSAAPATGGNTGFGAVIGGSAATPSPAIPTPPVPPAGATPAAPTVAAPPVVSTSPTLRGPGSPVPPAPAPSVNAPRDSMMPGPRAALQGGVPVASANALAPNVGPAGPPSPLVPSDVDAIMAGVNARRGAPSTGTQTAFNTIATGPGTEEAQGYKTSADRLAADDVAAAEYQNTKFPYVQALKNYGEGTKTGPTSDFWNQVAGTIRTPLAKIGINIGSLDDNTQRQDALGKWLATIQSGNPVSAKSDAELAQVLKGSASTHINETTGADMVKAGQALLDMKTAANREWHNHPDVQRQYGTYLNFLGAYNQNTDPRAFAMGTYNPAQIARLREQLKNGSEADAQRFEASLALARRNGMADRSGSQAMP
jgi:hypothetical protein